MKLRATISIAILLTSLVWAQKSPRLESAMTVIESTLPRKAKGHPEAYPNAIVMYDSVTAPDGKHLRTIITKPRGAKKKLPVIFVAGWLSCDSVEAPADTKDESGLVFRGLAQLQEFALFRMDKQGVGDSEGDCGETDFESELTAYRAAFRAVKNYDFIDANRIYILGISNGGGFAPLVPESDAEQAQVRGYISIGGWVKTWFEHMLEIERRRFALMGKSPGEVNDRMKGAATLYHEWLIEGRSLGDILKEQPQFADLWPRGKRPHASLRTAARVLSAATKIKSRRCVVACESSDLRASRRIRLDDESGGFRIDFDLRKQEWRSGVFLRNPGYGAHLSTLFESGRRIQRKESAIRSKDDRALSRLAAKQSDYA